MKLHFSDRRSSRSFAVIVLAVMSIGCGSQFQEGDEAWIRIPGSALVFDRYALVEVTGLSDRGIRVELIEMNPLANENQLQSMNRSFPDIGLYRRSTKSKKTERMLERLEKGRYFAQPDELMSWEQGEAALDIWREYIELFYPAHGQRSEFDEATLVSIFLLSDDVDFEQFDVEQLEAIRQQGERQGLQEPTRTLNVLIPILDTAAEMAFDIDDDPLILDRQRVSLLDDALELVYESIRDDEELYHTWTAMLLEVMSSKSGGKHLPEIEQQPLETAFARTDFIIPFLLVATSGPFLDFVAHAKNRLDEPSHLDGLDAWSSIATSMVQISLSLADTLLKVLPNEGRYGASERESEEWLNALKRSMLSEVERQIVQQLVEQEENNESIDDLDQIYESALAVGEKFEDLLGDSPVHEDSKIHLMEGLIDHMEVQLVQRLDQDDFESAVNVMDTRIQLGEELARLYREYDESKLGGQTSRAFGEIDRAKVINLITDKAIAKASNLFVEGATTPSDPEAILTEIRGWIEPLEKAAKGTIFDEGIYARLRNDAELRASTGALRVGQTWNGWVECTESYLNYKDSTHRNGRFYQSGERLEVTLELIEAGRVGNDRRTFAGKLIGEHLTDPNVWRTWDTAAGRWNANKKQRTTQFVVVTFQPSSRDMSIQYGVLDRTEHRKRYGPGDYAIQPSKGWQVFNGTGTLQLSSPFSVSGNLSRAYSGETCRTFSLWNGSPPQAQEDDRTDESIADKGDSKADSQSTSSLTETEIGSVKSRGMSVYALSDSDTWCGERVTLKITGEQADIYTDGTVAYYLQQLGSKGFVENEMCPAARTMTVQGYAGGAAEPVFEGTASAGNGWALVQ